VSIISSLGGNGGLVNMRPNSVPRGFMSTPPASLVAPDVATRNGTAPTAPVTNTDSLESRLDQLSPGLSKIVRSVLQMLEVTDPRAARAFKESMSKVLDHLGESRGESAGVAAGATPNGASAGMQVRAQQIEFAFQATVTELQVKLNSGESVSAQQVQFAFQFQFTEVLGQADPLVLDLNGNSQIDTTTARQGVLFDLLGNGRPVLGATVAGGDGFLAIDRNGNGLIDTGKELFGDQNGAVDGFAELAKMDSNSDGRIDASDNGFHLLRIYQDNNRNGWTDPGELSSLSQFRIQALLLESTASSENSSGNMVSRISSYIRDDGSQGKMGDVLLNYFI
jgi:hypothetical protein